MSVHDMTIEPSDSNYTVVSTAEQSYHTGNVRHTVTSTAPTGTRAIHPSYTVKQWVSWAACSDRNKKYTLSFVGLRAR